MVSRLKPGARPVRSRIFGLFGSTRTWRTFSLLSTRSVGASGSFASNRTTPPSGTSNAPVFGSTFTSPGWVTGGWAWVTAALSPANSTNPQRRVRLKIDVRCIRSPLLAKGRVGPPSDSRSLGRGTSRAAVGRSAGTLWRRASGLSAGFVPGRTRLRTRDGLSHSILLPRGQVLGRIDLAEQLPLTGLHFLVPERLRPARGVQGDVVRGPLRRARRERGGAARAGLGHADHVARARLQLGLAQHRPGHPLTGRH